MQSNLYSASIHVFKFHQITVYIVDAAFTTKSRTNKLINKGNNFRTDPCIVGTVKVNLNIKILCSTYLSQMQEYRGIDE